MPRSKFRITNILDKDFRGWLPVIDTEGNKFELFYSTLVTPEDNDSNFTVLEGFHMSKEVKIDYKALPHRLFSEYFGSIKIPRKHHSVILDLKSSQIIFEKSGKIVQYSAQANDLELGSYLILNPDRRHTDRITEVYMSEKTGGSRFAETWFPLFKEKFEFKYLHFGAYSNGCATILSGEGWTDLYFNVITSRLNETAHGILIVIADLEQFKS